MRKPATENDPPDKTDAAPSEEQSDATDGPSTTKNAHPNKVVKRRTKTGCLTCRQRRIKCGEEKPICHNCIKSKRECKGYAQRVIFKDPIGITEAFNNAHVSPMRTSFPSGYERRFFHHGQTPSELINAPARQSSVMRMTDNLAVQTDGTSTAPLQYPPGQILHHEAPNLAHPAFNRIPTLSELHRQPASWGSDSYSSPKSASSLGLPTQNLASHPNGQFDSTQSVRTVLLHGPAYTAGHLPLTASVSQPLEPQFWNPNVGPTQEQCAPYNPRTYNSPWPAVRASYPDNYGDKCYHSNVDGSSMDEPWRNASLTTTNRSELQLGSLTTHLNEPNILASYRPTLDSTPLNDPKAAKIFVHFIHSIGPFLSIFERHPVDSPIPLGTSVAEAQQGLWTYTLPFQALEHQALLQAMLAISSLHISFLQQAPQTVSLKHYHYALKRVGSAVGLPTRRQQCGTLAATLLLGYYEVVAADHTKWNSHVAGSAQLVREIDYASLTRDLRAHRRRMRGNMVQADWWLTNNPHTVSGDDPFAEKEASIDQDFIGTIFGRTINYDEYGQVENGSSKPYQKHFTQRDIENFRIQCDLYWWYCKQDTIQSIISGNQLFMPYYRWAQCPPRASMGRLDAVYGSADHLWLLLGRLTDFGYRDRKRKLKAIKVSGEDWKPNPGLFKFMARFAGGSSSMRGPPPRGPTGPAQGDRGSHPSSSSGNNSSPAKEGSPPMYGMVPPRGPVQLPLAFQDNASHPTSSPDQDNDDGEDITYDDAENEWERILAAFDAFAHALGHDFMPLPDTTPPTLTPFGRALQYPTKKIAVLWGFYYTGQILLLRLHPSMPPAMMVAAGVAAPATAAYAQTIGKIAASVYNPQLLNIGPDKLSPTQGCYMAEMTVPIFFSAVQYTDPGQREWTVVNLRNVSRLTGWKSSDAIASGCERSWVVAAAQGRGPPYQPTSEARRQPTTDPSLQQGPYHNTERRFVSVSKSNRLHWAMGILSLEDDVEV